MKKTVNIAFFAIITSIMISCSWRSYTVKPGRHSCSKVPEITFNQNSLEFIFETNKTWQWPNAYPSGWSKIYGLSEGNHSKHSVRLGYRCNDGYMIVGLYGRVEGEPFAIYMDTIHADQQYKCKIFRSEGDYVVQINGKQARCPAPEKDYSVGYILYPYVGGEYVWPFKWKVRIKKEPGN